jgi:hypothetical protein
MVGHRKIAVAASYIAASYIAYRASLASLHIAYRSIAASLASRIAAHRASLYREVTQHPCIVWSGIVYRRIAASLHRGIAASQHRCIVASASQHRHRHHGSRTLHQGAGSPTPSWYRIAASCIAIS